MPRSLIILRFLTATAKSPSNAPAACSTVPGRCKRLLAAGRNDILGCDDAAGRCGVPTPGGPAAPWELRRGGRSLDACPPGTTLTLPDRPAGRGAGRHGGACQTTRARRPVPPHLRQPAEELRRHRRSPPKDQHWEARLARAANGLRFSGGAMPRSLIILRFLTATATCPSNAPAACSTVPGRCKRLLAAGRNDILGCDDAAGRCGVPTPGGPAAPRSSGGAEDRWTLVHRERR